MKEKKVRITLLTEALGTLPTDPDVYIRFVEMAKRDKLFPKNFDISRELENIARASEDQGEGDEEGEAKNGNPKTVSNPKMLTAFPRNEAFDLIMYQYQIRGFFKEACGSLRKANQYDSEWGRLSAKLASHKKVIDGAIFVSPDEIPIHVPEGKLSIVSRSLRVDTFPERVCIASSEAIPAGSYIDFTILYPEKMEDILKEWLDYGAYKGLLQWRSGGKGRFKWEEIV